MKRLIPLILVCLMLLNGCSQPAAPANPTESQIPTDPTTAPKELPPQETSSVTVPSVPTEPSVPPTTEESVAPSAPEEAVSTTDPAFASYTIRVEDPERLIYAEPGFRYTVTATFEEAGVYTIVEEASDWDGNLWGKLKSGIGWVCLTEPPITPIHADYAPEHFVSDYEWHCGETEYVTDIGILANEHITDVQISLLNYIPEYQTEELLYTVDELDADQALKVSVVFWGDFTTYGVSFTDANGNQRTYALMISGKDGSLICSEYQA